ncbi:DUF695 domain-containing protein [Myroides sp. NP-2]|uniref:DUF695 domain-containing protein n=1 Tax=Myroides sp. NP-2 TaxID=2759945 RepID=UPI0015F8C985|nr:DUF695 domain-containing protein [Myroides sp. NP-2]MBB1150160.1 DUF695 domain-containing protein [Myroides sp. NP-2]
MSILKNIFAKKENPINSPADFWVWFQENEQAFYRVVKGRDKIEEDFFDRLAPKLQELKEGIYFLSGMMDDETAELIFTPDGIVKNVAFIEDLVAAAPSLKNWKFTSLKPAVDISRFNIRMNNYEFSKEKINFYAVEHPQYPDEVDLVIVYDDYTASDKAIITNGVYIFLDNLLGELNAITSIDNLSVIGPDEAAGTLIPILKLKDYLVWREKEFIEKYEGMRYDTEKDSYVGLEGTLENGMPLIALINRTILDWDAKASHPWIVRVEIAYKANENGFPDESTYQLLNQVEDELIEVLPDTAGYLNLGRETVDGNRDIFFACKDFRLPARVLEQMKMKYKSDFSLGYAIYKDKYWQSFERYKG